MARENVARNRGGDRMIVQTAGVVLDALDYELVWIGTDPDREPTGDFRDVHHVVEPAFRLVTGYLGISDDGESWRITSHGHPVARLALDGDDLRFSSDGSPTFGGAVFDGDVLDVPAAGLALVPDASASLVLEGSAATATGGGVTVVHGPAAVKVRNRRALLESLQRTGGRRG